MKNFTLFFFFLFSVLFINAQNVVNVTDETLSGDAHWTADNIYMLDGFVYLESGTLTIDPGTVVKGLATPTTGDNASALIITRDAKIMAEGTPEMPIIFTAEDDDVNDPTDLTHEDRSLWGGLVILGYGIIGDETSEASIEGIPAGEPRAVYGGTDDTHNAGVLRYISIRHGGAELAPGDEINGLSIAGIGSETTIDHIEVFANSDDGYEFWGGTVNAKYMVAAFCGDDGFDYDDGWRGNGQFWFVIQAADDAGSAGEHDGAHPDDNERFAKPTIYNATYIGPGIEAINDDVAMMLRDGAGGMYANSIFTDFPAAAIEVEDRAADKGTDARKHMEDGDLVFKNNIWYGFGPGDELVAGKMIQVTGDAEDANAAFLVSHLTANSNSIEDPKLRGISRDTDGMLDPRIGGGSPAVKDVAETPADPFFSTAPYKGAFGDENWALGWTATDALGYFGDLPYNGGTVVEVSDDDLTTGDVTWTADNTYLLDGFVYLEGGTLTIEPGTVIKGKATPTTGDNASALIITRDAKIMAEGTPELPIIFTAEDDDVNDPTDLTHEDRSLWGGLVILGYGIIGDETAEASIEGIPAGEARATYGGTDDTHNAGVLRYISIRHGGAELAPGDEINGLSIAGVGSETTIDHIEVFANSDDGYEFWGGTVWATHMVAAFCGDDGFDYDDGWRGGGQFWFVIQAADDAGSAGEHDGAHPDDNDRFAKPVISNVTYIGPGMDAINDDVALMLRDGAGGMYANSIFTDFPAAAIEVEDRAADKGTDARKHMEDGDLVFKNNIWFGFGPGDELVAGKMIQVTGDAEDPTAAFLINHLTANNNSIADPKLRGISRVTDGMLDPRLAAGSPAWGGISDELKSATFENTDMLEKVSYRGAFASNNWALDWTALDAMGYFGDLDYSDGGSELLITDDDLTTEDVTWTAENTYLLDGFVYLEGGTLTIEPGTVIKGKATPSTGDNASALIITRDAKIMAEGTPELPIIFTAEDDDVNDPTDLTHEDRSLWGGLVILGYGIIGDETAEASIEGIPAGEARATYGGTDDTHNAGVLRYISIRHGGAELAPGDEINGLSIAGVGSETTIDHIEVFANSDDGYEFWGGTVWATHMVAAFCGDDGFDYDDGWRGGGQFWFVIQAADDAGSAGEHDGAHPDDNERFAKPTIYNATYIGPGIDAINDDVALMLRDGAGGMYANSIFTDFPAAAIEVEDRAADKGTDARKHMEDGDLVFKNNIWYGFGPGDELVAGKMIQVTGDAEDPTAAFLINHLISNNNSIEDPMISSISREPNMMLDPRPNPQSPAWTNVASLKSATDNDEMMEVNFRGAFGSENWAKMWTALDAMGYFGELYVSSIEITDNGYNLGQNYPNPYNGTTTIEYAVPEKTDVNISIFDITGKLVRTAVSQTQAEGTYKVRISGLQKGIYFYQMVAGDYKATNKMIVK